VLSFNTIKQFTHLLEKSGDGSFFNEEVFNAENDADSLALELLAPAMNIVSEIKGSFPKIQFQDFKVECYHLLYNKYGFPKMVSEDYAARLAYSVTGGPSLLTKFGF